MQGYFLGSWKSTPKTCYRQGDDSMYIHPESRPGPKRKRSYSNHPFSGANMVSMLVSGRLVILHFWFPHLKWNWLETVSISGNAHFFVWKVFFVATKNIEKLSQFAWFYGHLLFLVIFGRCFFRVAQSWMMTLYALMLPELAFLGKGAEKWEMIHLSIRLCQVFQIHLQKSW